jgi:UDP-N-acetylglucosamine--N-acetylmuramyl-(pentapeptide) pyrophosphoryl-undecaprenol N-acetylglucosamine transferase
LLALKKPNILVPLSLNASRVDQILNARSFESQGFSYVIEEEQVTEETLLSAIKEVYENKERYIDAMSKSKQADAIKTIVDLIDCL